MEAKSEEMDNMREGDTIIDEKRGILYMVKNSRGGLMMIQRLSPAYDVWTNLDLDCFWNPDAKGER